MKFKKMFSLMIILILSVSTFFLTGCIPESENGGGGEIILPEIPITPGTDEKLEDLFSKLKIISDDVNAKVMDPVTMRFQTFEYLLDREITILSTDIITRLVAVYGNYFSDPFIDLNIEGDFLNYNGDLSINKFDVLDRHVGFNYNIGEPKPEYKIKDGSNVYIVTGYPKRIPFFM